MDFVFKILDKNHVNLVIPLVQKLNGDKILYEVLAERFSEMVTQNYECAVIFYNNKIVGVCGMWFCTRHYAGKSVELDHVFIDNDYRGQGLGKHFFKWIYRYVEAKGCKTVELNTYVGNYPSHKFYYNEGFEILGYHFFKKL